MYLNLKLFEFKIIWQWNGVSGTDSLSQIEARNEILATWSLFIGTFLSLL